uniref:Uncharacterized protein n=1 Tax=Avena sativa TaxID=4498 RepID=A0ACD5Z1H0_AVESA
MATRAATNVATSSALSSHPAAPAGGTHVPPTSAGGTLAPAAPAAPVHNSYSPSLVSFSGVVDEPLDLRHGSYGAWREALELQLEIYHVLDHIAADAVPHPEDREWHLKDLCVKRWLRSTLSADLRSMVSTPTSTARDIWAAVEAVFLNNGMARAMNLTEELQQLKQLDTPLSTYCARVKAISDALRDVGFPLASHVLILKLVRGLHRRHETVGKLIQDQAATITFAAVVDKLSMDEMQTAGSSSPSTGSTTALLSVNRHGGQGTYGSPNTPSPNQGNQKHKRNNNHGGYNHNAASARPWTGYVQAWQLPFATPPRPAMAPGILGSRPPAVASAFTSFSPVQYPGHYGVPPYAVPPSVAASPQYGLSPPTPALFLLPASFGTPASTTTTAPVAFGSPSSPATTPSTSNVASFNQSALLGALHDLSLGTGGWVADTGASAHMTGHTARWVVRGFSQEHGIDYDETFSPVVKPSTIRLVLSLVVSSHWPIHQLDVKNAFLHGHLSEVVYCQQPLGFKDPAHPSHVCLLNKSLYGLKQAPRSWFTRFATYVATIGFQASKSDTSLFVLRTPDHNAYLLLYVDDIILTASSTSFLDHIISTLSSEFSMTDLGPLSHFLGISASRTSVGLHLSQKQYSLELIQRVDMTDCNPVTTPIDSGSKTSLTDGDLLDNPTHYRSLVGALQYLTLTRPEIAYAVHQTCLFMHAPRSTHLNLVKRIIRYIKGTLDHGTLLVPSSTSSLVAYSDADWAGYPDTRRSTTGFCVFLGENLISWSAKRQTTVSRSSAEAEYHVVAHVVAECCWIPQLLQELHQPVNRSTVVYCDNVSAVYLSANPVQHRRTKHIEVDIHFVRDKVQLGESLSEREEHTRAAGGSTAGGRWWWRRLTLIKGEERIESGH